MDEGEGGTEREKFHEFWQQVRITGSGSVHETEFLKVRLSLKVLGLLTRHQDGEKAIITYPRIED